MHNIEMVGVRPDRETRRIAELEGRVSYLAAALVEAREAACTRCVNRAALKCALDAIGPYTGVKTGKVSIRAKDLRAISVLLSALDEASP